MHQASSSEEPAAIVLANFGHAVAVQLPDGRVVRAQPLQKIALLVAGDRVVCEQPLEDDEQTWRVVELVKRRTVLTRPDRRGKLKALAANVTQLLVVCAPRPAPDTLLLDQFLAAGRNAGIEPVLVLNKSDLLPAVASPSDQDPLTLLAAYADAGFATLTCHTTSAEGLQSLHECIGGETSVLVGQSGVGKSSIADVLLPDQDIRIGAISAATGAGAHTTTVSFYYELESGGALIDSPGVREFLVDHLDAQELRAGYPEIDGFAAECRFHNCAHAAEPDCAVKQAISEGSLATFRYDNWLKLSSASASGRKVHR